jgi:DNA-binding NarL/FixJ family response regulator
MGIVLALVSLVAVAALSGLGVVVWRERTGTRITAAHLDDLQRQLARLQRDMHELASQVHELTGKFDRNTLRAVKDSEHSTPYQQAIELVRQGLAASEVAVRCGISRSEAELIVSLYRNNSPS